MQRIRWAVALAATVSTLIGLSAAQATAAEQYSTFCPGTSAVAGYSRCVAYSRLWLYGVRAMLPVGAGNVCVGAKTNSDGSGGNAIPFRCEWMDQYGLNSMWTAGGNSNYGYATVINQNAYELILAGAMRYRV